MGLHNYVALKHTPSLSRHQPVVAQVLLWKCFARLSFPFLFELKYVMGFRNTGFNELIFYLFLAKMLSGF